jgi:hypothetical protein
MGTRGPVPKRSDRRVRRNKDGGEVERLAVDGGPVEAPPLGFVTHDIAMEWYASLAESGQARYFEPSDWQAARVIAHEVGRMLNRREASGQLLSAVWSAMNDLLTTEAARRRVRLELDRGAPAEDGENAAVIQLRKGLGL